LQQGRATGTFVLLLSAAMFFSHPVLAQECANPQPDWVFCEDFEGASFLAQWQEVSHSERKVRETNPDHVLEGNSSMKLVFPPGDEEGSGYMHHWWDPGPDQPEIYLRFYVKYQNGFDYGDWDVKMPGVNGHRPGDLYGPRAGQEPDGTEFSCHVLSLGIPDSRGPSEAKEPMFYYYHLDQGGPWGQFGYQNQGNEVALDDGRWYCIETWVKVNTVNQHPDGSYTELSDGEQRMWIDGQEVAYYNGIRWRNRPDVQANDLFHTGWTGRPTASAEQYRWEDAFVVSTSRIGCLSGNSGENPATPTGLERTDTVE